MMVLVMFPRQRRFSRRGFGRILGAVGLTGLFRKPQFGAGRLEWNQQPAASFTIIRRYRADAQVVVLSVPILRRSGVGGGAVTWAEENDVRVLEFTGHSLPERAAGLNRLGFIREMSRLGKDNPESIYFGLMTASPEESAAQARDALHHQSQEALYSAIEGHMAPGQVETRIAHFTAPSALSATHQDELIQMARRALSTESEKAPEFNVRAGCEGTFLQALADIVRDPAASETSYVYGGRRYHLWLHKFADAKATEHFREQHLIGPNAKVIRAAGKVRREAGGKESNFQLWVEESAARPLPLRIEYQAKSYLRLMFEAE